MPSKTRRLRDLEDENNQLKRIVEVVLPFWAGLRLSQGVFPLIFTPLSSFPCCLNMSRSAFAFGLCLLIGIERDNQWGHFRGSSFDDAELPDPIKQVA